MLRIFLIVFIFIQTISAQTNVYICQLGDVDQADLLYAKKVVEEVFNYNCKISTLKSEFTPDMFISGTSAILNGEIALKAIHNPARKDIHIYLTEKRIWHYKEMRGITFLGGKTILAVANQEYLKETIIHEIGHTFGLRHCTDLTCVMASNNDQYDKMTFCSICLPVIKNFIKN